MLQSQKGGKSVVFTSRDQSSHAFAARCTRVFRGLFVIQNHYRILISITRLIIALYFINRGLFRPHLRKTSLLRTKVTPRRKSPNTLPSTINSSPRNRITPPLQTLWIITYRKEHYQPTNRHSGSQRSRQDIIILLPPRQPMPW